MEEECHINNAVIDSASQLAYPPTGGPEGPPASAKSKGDLSGLTAKVVRIKVMDDVGPTTITALKPPAGLAYKVYRDGETDCDKINADHPSSRRLPSPRSRRVPPSTSYSPTSSTSVGKSNWLRTRGEGGGGPAPLVAIHKRGCSMVNADLGVLKAWSAPILQTPAADW